MKTYAKVSKIILPGKPIQHQAMNDVQGSSLVLGKLPSNEAICALLLLTTELIQHIEVYVLDDFGSLHFCYV